MVKLAAGRAEVKSFTGLTVGPLAAQWLPSCNADPKLEFTGKEYKEMSIRKAVLTDLGTVKDIVRVTISTIYPHYYPKGAVDFFLAHHNDENIRRDIARGQVFLCFAGMRAVTGTVTVKDNEICRLFVLPQWQGRGFGRELLDFAENIAAGQYAEIVLDASLPAKHIYQKRGYTETEFHMIKAGHGDFLCYDVMKKSI